MHHKTKKKLDTLRQYIQRHYRRWHKKYPNLAGAYPGEKYTAGSPIGRYSIVFLVSKKEASPSLKLPSYFLVDIPGMGKKKVPTDVRKTGNIRLRSIDPGDKIKRTNFPDYGSIGVFLQQETTVFACSNSHVLLPDMISQGKTYFYRPTTQQTNPDVTLFDSNGQRFNGFLQEGHFDDIDAAIARIPDTSEVANTLKGLGDITGPRTIQSSDLGTAVTMVGLVSGVVRGKVNNVGITWPSPIGQAVFNNLVELSIVSRKGDSGSPVVDNALQIVGIIIAGDAIKSYMIPIEHIMDAFGCDLLS